jgi:hypothetical protein
VAPQGHRTNPLPREKAARMLALRGEDCSQLD